MDGGRSVVRKSRKPIRIPTTMSRHDSGKMCASFGVMWKPARVVGEIELVRELIFIPNHAEYVIETGYLADKIGPKGPR